MIIESDKIDLSDLLNPKDISSLRFGEHILYKLKQLIENGEEVKYVFNYENGTSVYILSKDEQELVWKKVE